MTPSFRLTNETPKACRLPEQQDKVPEVPSQASESLARQDVEAAAPRVPDHLVEGHRTL
jgi:hypothetical protein